MGRTLTLLRSGISWLPPSAMGGVRKFREDARRHKRCQRENNFILRKSFKRQHLRIVVSISKTVPPIDGIALFPFHLPIAAGARKPFFCKERALP